jgi:hypothetical protein
MRHVPFGARLSPFLGVLTQAGSGLLLFSMLFVWVFFPFADLGAPLLALAGSVTTTATVLAVEGTGASEGGSNVTRVRYEMLLPGERVHEGVGFVTGSAPEAGSTLQVSYPRGLPGLARAQGLRRSTFGLGASMVIVFPVVAVALLAAGIVPGLRAGRVMGSGKLALGRLVSKSPTNTRVNDRTVYRMTFAFEDEAGARHECVVRTSLTGRLEDEGEELVLYDPRDPSRNCPVDAIPGGVVMDSEGRIIPKGPVAVGVRLLLPAATVGIHGYVAVAKVLQLLA